MITPMADETRTIKIRLAAYRQLKILAARQGETMLDLLDRLVKHESQSVEAAHIAHNIAHSVRRSPEGSEDIGD